MTYPMDQGVQKPIILTGLPRPTSLDDRSFTNHSLWARFPALYSVLTAIWLISLVEP